MGTSDDFDSLLKKLRLPSGTEHRRAIMALAKLKDTRSIGPLIEIAESSADFLDRCLAIQSLGELGFKDAEYRLRLLLDVFENGVECEREDLISERINLLCVTITALGSLKDASMTGRFMNYLNHTHFGVVSAALNALANLEYAPLIEASRRLLKDPRPFVQISAMSCLVDLGLKLNIDVRTDLESLLLEDDLPLQEKAKNMLWLYEKLLSEKSHSE
jgi:HEAT repeat protein